MDKSQLKDLIAKINKGTASDDELVVYNAYMNRLTPGDTKWDVQDMDEPEMIKQELWEKVSNGIKLNKPAKTVWLWPRIAVAVSILLFLSVGGYFFLRKQPDIQIAQIQQNDVTPGGNKAILTLANGSKIILDDSKNGIVASQGNTKVLKTGAGHLIYNQTGNSVSKVFTNTMTTPRGGKYDLILSDGTVVWLNAASSITYPSAFTGKDREVVITGEAYFEVAHNAKKPFKVISQNQTIEVLGTHFDINAYTDEPNIKTTLLEGSVKISGVNSFKIIKPGQQAIFSNNNIEVSDANTEEAIAWKNGYFRFNGEKIQSIMRKLSRWYDVDIQFQGPIPDEEYSGKVSRSRNISQVLKILEYSQSVHFKVEGRRITVLK